jgi:hypothetical protein
MDFMNSPVLSQAMVRFNSASSPYRPASVSVCSLSQDVIACFGCSERTGDLLKSIFRVTVAQPPLPQCNALPAVSGRYFLFADELQFVPHFPFDRDVKYRAVFDTRPLGAFLAGEPLNLEFIIPSERNAPALTEVTHIFPSCDLLPENLLRFYACFSNSMQRGRALEEISLLDSLGQPVADALYRPPVELWDRTMRCLTVLLDPGRLKRGAGPNVALGPPLRAGQEYTLEIGSGMIDINGRPLRERFRKHFIAGDPVRERISAEYWKILPPVTDSREALVLTFSEPLDWALLLQTITIRSTDCERRWNFKPSTPWKAGKYHISVGSSLEDVCGNNLTGAFDRPLLNGPNAITDGSACSLTFELI